MENVKKMLNLKIIPITDLKPGHTLVNLGELLEVEEQNGYFVLVISRLEEKQVFKFERDTRLMIL